MTPIELKIEERVMGRSIGNKRAEKNGNARRNASAIDALQRRVHAHIRENGVFLRYPNGIENVTP
jgi:hypothetical protein